MRDPQEEIDSLVREKLRRGLRIITPDAPPYCQFEGHRLLNFSSNDYLGFSRHPSLYEAAARALRDYGTGATASRLVCGSLDLQHELEAEIAQAKKTSAALTFASGYATAVGVLPALAQKGDTLILDKLCHASLIDGARLSGATIRVFPHNHLEKLEKILRQTQTKAPTNSRTIVITESVFSMDGDRAPLREIIELKEKYGAWLLVDEAHALGVFGKNGLGLAEELGLQNRIELQMGTLGKALGSAGGYLAASRSIIDLLINRARSFIYSTAPPPAQNAASLAALRLLLSPEGQEIRQKLHRNIAHFQKKLFSLTFEKNVVSSQIIPLIMGDNQAALSAASHFMAHGILIPAIRYPTVPLKRARLRLTLSAAHETSHIDGLISLLCCLRTEGK